MEQVGMNGVQQVSYVAPSAASEPSFTSAMPPEQKEDGDKKLMNALLGLGAIALGGIAIYTGRKIKLNKVAQEAGDKLAQEAAEKAAKEAAEKAAKEASEKAAKEAAGSAGTTLTKMQTKAKAALEKHNESLKKATAQQKEIAKQMELVKSALKQQTTKKTQNTLNNELNALSAKWFALDNEKQKLYKLIEICKKHLA